MQKAVKRDANGRPMFYMSSDSRESLRTTFAGNGTFDPHEFFRPSPTRESGTAEKTDGNDGELAKGADTETGTDKPEETEHALSCWNYGLWQEEPYMPDMEIDENWYVLTVHL